MDSDIPVSTIPKVRQYLYEKVGAAVTAENYSDPGVSVFLGNLSDPEDYSDLIVIGQNITRQTDASRIVGSGRRHWLVESYSLAVHIECTSASGAEFTDCDARAYELLGLVESVVRADPSLGGLVRVARPDTSQFTSDYDEAHGGAQSTVDAVISVLADL